jgi:hypothetical protein
MNSATVAFRSANDGRSRRVRVEKSELVAENWQAVASDAAPHQSGGRFVVFLMARIELRYT